MASRILDELDACFFDCAAVLAPSIKKVISTYNKYKKTAEFIVIYKNPEVLLTKASTLILFNLTKISLDSKSPKSEAFLAKEKKEACFKNSLISKTLYIDEYGITWTVCGIRSLNSGKWIIKPTFYTLTKDL